MRKPAKIRVLSATLACAAALSATALFAAAGNGAESPLGSQLQALPPANQGVIQVAQADAAPADKPVSYTNDQADRGQKKFESECVDCHGDDLRGGMNGGPPLKGLSFEEKYANGAPASGLFMFMSTLMPPNAPGRYSPAVYADLMAYILKKNGFQAGAELPSDVDALDHLLVEK